MNGPASAPWNRFPPALHDVRAAAAALRSALPGSEAARIGVVLGSGLGGFTRSLDAAACVPTTRLPGFPVARVEGHAGEVVFGRCADVPVLVLRGRTHLYEGWSPREVVLPVRALIACGVERILVTNAAGGIDPTFGVGDLMLIEDHLNLTGANPLAGPDEPGLGPRFPDMSRAYDPELGEAVVEAAGEAGVTLRRGVYAGLAGPSYETPAEIRMLRTVGAHAVGMSTVLEVIAARHMGARVCGVSCISNAAAGSVPGAVLTHDEVKETTSRFGGGFVEVLAGTLARWARTGVSDVRE